MEKENKYYSIIEFLVKKHRKFPGLEPILEDIVDDVYSHSEVILKTINNEAVINAYLEKVVSTSIITVPKQMNFHPEVSHAIISNTSLRQEQVKDVDNKLVDKMINGSASFKETDNTIEDTADTLLDTNELEENILIDEVPEFVEPQIEEAGLDSYSETLQSLDMTNIIESPLELDNDVEVKKHDIEPPCNYEDFDFADNIINAEEAEEEAEEDNTDDEKQIITEENSGYNSTAEFVEEIETEKSDYLEQDELIENDVELVPQLNIENMDDNNIELALEETNDLNMLEESNTEDILDIETNSEDLTEETAEECETENDEIENFVPIDYSVFEFEPEQENKDLDANSIVNDLTELSAKHPELNIIDIYNLKYKDNLSISEVASKLNISENEVIEALNEIIAVI